MSSIVRQLDASRRLEEELAVEKHRQELEKQKIERELEGLRRSRKEYIDTQLQTSQKDYEARLRENPDIAEEHFERQKRVEKERSKVAQQDFEKERQRLLEERNQHDDLDRQYRDLDKALLDLQAKSRFAT
jgi:GTP1/Obg family GTP-binding protein